MATIGRYGQAAILGDREAWQLYEEDSGGGRQGLDPSWAFCPVRSRASQSIPVIGRVMESQSDEGCKAAAVWSRDPANRRTLPCSELSVTWCCPRTWMAMDSANPFMATVSAMARSMTPPASPRRSTFAMQWKSSATKLRRSVLFAVVTCEDKIRVAGHGVIVLRAAHRHTALSTNAG